MDTFVGEARTVAPHTDLIREGDTPHDVHLIDGGTMSADVEFEHLATADRHIKRGTEIVLEQEAIVAGMERRGEDATEAKRLLANFCLTLVEFEVHRQFIIDKLLAAGHKL